MDKVRFAVSAETARAIMASPSFVLRSVLHEQALHIPTSPGARLRIEQDLVSLANDVYANPLYARDVAWTPEERAAGRVVAAEMIALANRLARGLSKATAHVGEVHRWQDGKNHRKTADGWVEVPAGKPRFHILDNESEDELSMGEGTGAKPLTLDEAVAERDQYGTPIVVAYGMGVDSTAMLVGMHQRGVRPDKILFADTGGEKPETYAYRAYMDAWLAKHDFPPITVLKQKPTTNERGTYATLEENCLINNTLPSLAFGGRSCSQKWKHAPQHAFLRKDEAANEAWAKGRKLTKLIGYDAGPIDARRPHIGDDEHYRYAYPLREWGWDREESKRQIAAAGLPVPPKSACFFCPSSKPQELRELGADLLRRIVRMEAGAEGRQLERIKQGQKAIEGLWRAPVAGNRGATARPGSMTEFIAGEGLLPELAGQAEPWWNDNVDTPADTGAPDLFGYRPPTKVKRKVPVKARFPVEAMAGLLQKALAVLDGSLSKALPSRAVKPPRGFTPIPNSKHNGFHKRVNGKWVTWYPGHLERPHPTERFTHEEHEENHAKYQLSLPEAKRKPEFRGDGGAFFRDAKIGARVSIPNGTGKVVDINHNGTIKVRLDTGEDVNVYPNRVDAEPDKYRISHEPSADMSWSELYAISKVDAKSPQLVDALREKAKRTGRNATDADHQYMTVLSSMTGNDLVWLASHPTGGSKDGPDAKSVVPKSTDSWASIWAWSKTRDASTDRKAIQMLKRKAAVQGRQGVDDHAQMYMDNLGAIFDVDLSEVAKDAAFEHKLKKKAKEPVWVARDPGDVSNPSAQAMIAPGDRFIAPSGRVIEVPKKLSQRKIGAWLIDEAQKDLAFRQAGRPDNPHEWLSNESRQIDFDRTSIQGMNPKNLSKSDYDTLNMLVFGDEMGPTEGQRAVAIAKADGGQNTAQTEFESIFGVSALSKALPSQLPDGRFGFGPLTNAELWAKARGCEEAVRLPTNGEVWSRWPQDAMTARETDAANGAVGDLGVHQDEDGDWWYPISDYLGEMILAMSLFKAKYIKKRPTGRRDRPWRYYYKRPVKREPRPHPEYTFSDHDIGPPTWQEHFTGHPDEGGVPHDDRLPLHDKLIHEVLYRPGADGKPPDTRPRAIPTAILMMGAPGAGKSTILAGLRQRSDVVMIDPDEFKQKLPEYQDAIKDPSRMPLNAAHKVHHESSYIARRARDEAIAGRRNMMVDGTGRNAAAMIELCDRLRSTGYRVHLVFVHVSLEDSLSRIESRKNETGRHVPKSAAVECCELVPHSFDKVKDHVDSFDAWTTSAPHHNRLTFDNGPRAEIKRDANTKKLLSKRMGGPERVHDPVLVEKYLKEPLAYPPSLAD